MALCQILNGAIGVLSEGAASYGGIILGWVGNTKYIICYLSYAPKSFYMHLASPLVNASPSELPTPCTCTSAKYFSIPYTCSCIE